MSIPQFNAAASLYRTNEAYELGATLSSADHVGQVIPALVGRWELSSRCQISCIEVCTRFCRPTGWDCCQWQTRCALSCDGKAILTNY
jgi:hypothetical protein